MVSVIMPVYNTQRYIAEAVESILSQTFTDFEFIIIDDGSTDGSLAILQKYAAQDDRIRLVSRPNTGIVGALNEGIYMARGEYIARMDSDDVSTALRIAREVNYLESHRECVAVSCPTILIDPDGMPLFLPDFVTGHDEIDAQYLTGRGGGMAHPASLIRRQDLDAIGGYRQEYEACESIDLFLRLAEKGCLANLPDRLYLYRQHLGSVTHAGGRSQRNRSVARLLSETYKRRGMPTLKIGSAYEVKEKSCSDQYMVWGWWAFSCGFWRTARKYGLKSVYYRPFSHAAWRLAVCTLMGRYKSQIAKRTGLLSGNVDS